MAVGHQADILLTYWRDRIEETGYNFRGLVRKGKHNMKTLFLAAMLATTSLSGHTHADVIQFQHKMVKYAQQNPSLDEWINKMINDMNRLEASPDNIESLNQQMSQVFDDIDQVHKLMTLHRIGIKQLPGPGSNSSQNVSPQIQISVGDNQVSGNTLALAGQTVKDISLPILKENLGYVPDKSTHVVLFSTKNSYRKALKRAGVPTDQISKIVNETGGLTVQSDIWIPLYALQDQSELANVLTHELTHVVLNQQNIGDEIPVWLNEGIAWHDGMLAKSQVSPLKAQQEWDALNAQLQQAVDAGIAVPLTASEDDILNAQYNVEWEDYLAVRQLIQNGGQEKFKSFIQQVEKDGVEKSFLTTFGIPMKEYENNFYQSI